MEPCLSGDASTLSVAEQRTNAQRINLSYEGIDAKLSYDFGIAAHLYY
jgi:hypothetical protein